jgi:hypothetical protein
MRVRVETLDVSDEARRAIAKGLEKETVKRGTISEYLRSIVQKHIDDLHIQQAAEDRAALKASKQEQLATLQQEIIELEEGDEAF